MSNRMNGGTSRRLASRILLSAIPFVVAIPFVASRTQVDTLRYELRAAPGNITVDRTAGGDSAKTYSEMFTFVVRDPGDSDYRGASPDCQVFDVAVLSPDPNAEPLWRWSHSRTFCQHATPIRIGSGDSWKKVVRWTFAPADVKDGRYKAVATFFPSRGTATTTFRLTSTQ